MKPSANSNKTAYLVASGDLRLSANQVCWPEQERMELALAASAGAATVMPAMATSAIRRRLPEKIVLLRKRLFSPGSRDN